MLSIIIRVHYVYKGFCELKPKNLITILNNISMRKCIPGSKYSIQSLCRLVTVCIMPPNDIHLTKLTKHQIQNGYII